jgi:hypothetical protein
LLLVRATSLPEQPGPQVRPVPQVLQVRPVPQVRPVQALGPALVRVQPSQPAFALPPSCSQQQPSITSRRKAVKE